ncbi:MAG: adenine-specific methyltransferase EcoRI family protein [Selenomonadaceae bacterium]|nr:adenine-specific methyltransferase EcoRI family protein [Selenomonadaceae bacterium]
MARNKNLNSAARAKKDEFYTQLTDIEAELKHYVQHFKDKIVLCNCDDPYESYFFKYFAMHFNDLGLKKLITTCYVGSPIAQMEFDFFGTPNENPNFDKNKSAIMFEVNEVRDWNGDGRTDLADVKYLLQNNSNSITYLEGDGDFRSDECIAALKQADIVVTNPPFSLFREYVAQLIEYNKKFLIIGNINCITYKEIFPLIMENKIWLGNGMGRAISGFIVPETYELYGTEARISKEGKRIVSTNQCLWLTNLDFEKRHEEITLYKSRAAEPELFPRYDNYDAIEVPRTEYIPKDYYGVMGVPITFLDKYNPDQFEIIGATESEGSGFSNGLWHETSSFRQAVIHGKKVYKRLFIRRKSGEAAESEN